MGLSYCYSLNCLIFNILNYFGPIIALVFFSKLAYFQLFKLNIPSRSSRGALSEYVNEIEIRHSDQKLWAFQFAICTTIQLWKLINLDTSVGFQFWSGFLKALFKTVEMVYLVTHYLSGPQCPILAIGQWAIALVFFSKLSYFQHF